MSEVGCKTQEEYEDDFEKDLDWLISEESQIEDHGPDYEELEAEIDKELQKDEKIQEQKRKPRHIKEKKRGDRTEELEEDEERWPSPMEPLQYDSERDSPDRSSPIGPPPPDMEDQTDEDKEYILEKIQQANRELQDQEPPDMTRRRRLHFKEKLVDLMVPPLKFEKDDNVGEVEGREDIKDRAKDSETETEVSGKLSELKLSSHEESSESGGSGTAGESSEGRQGAREGRVLVEKDGKFDLVSLNEVESQGLLPPIKNHYNDYLQQIMSSSKIGRSSSSPRPPAGPSPFQHGTFHLRTPRPPAQSRSRPNSAIHSQSASHSNNSKRRVQSATGTTCNATYLLSPQQKELLQRIQERKERLAREAEQKKREEDEQKRQDNELAFKAWLMRKKEQLQEEKRIHRAQEMERMNSKGCISMSRQQKDSSDAEVSFRMWVQRKQEQQHRERQMAELKKMEEDSSYFLHTREECERAFKLWLRRKRAEKRAEQQVARERSRRLVLEERRARRMRDLLCNVNETKPFRFTEQLVWPY